MSAEAQHYVNLLAPYIHAYGYFVAFFGMMLENAGIPVPAESALIVLSFFAAQGALKIWLVIPIAVLGDAAGDNLGYLIGRIGGRPLVEKYGHYVRIDKAKLDGMERLFRERGGRTVFTAHFFSATRITAAVTAGISRMHYPRFLAFNLAAATTFVTLVASVTFYFGKNLDATLAFFRAFRIAGLAVITVVLAVYVYRYYREKGIEVPHLGAKIAAISTGIALVLWLVVYAISGFFVVLPRSGANAGATHGTVAGADFVIEQGFVSATGRDSLLVSGLGFPKIRFGPVRQPAFVVVTVRNVPARATRVKVRPAGQPAVVLDPISLSVGVNLVPGRRTLVSLEPVGRPAAFDFAVAADTRDAGPLFDVMISSVNAGKAFGMLHAGDFVKDGEKRRYRAFLGQTSALRVPLYTDLGAHEIVDGGEPTYHKLFGPSNYAFDYAAARFVIFDTAPRSGFSPNYAWLASQVSHATAGKNTFVITYVAPLDSLAFTSLMARAGVKRVFSVKTTGTYKPVVGGVSYETLQHRPGTPYSYRIVHVGPAGSSETTVRVSEQRLGVIDRIVLFFEDLKRRVLAPFGG